MKGWWIAGWLALGGGALLRAEPLVVGFDRFHAGQPDAAGGRLLYNELGCAHCHGGETGLPARGGPDLRTVTARAQADWLAAFIADPARLHPGTAMPRLLAAQPDPVAAAGDIAHYLGTLGPAVNARPRALRHINAERGRDLYHTRGCVACHAPRADYTPAEERPAASEFTHRSVGLPALADKYVLATLAEFIRDPLKTRPDGRMPRTELDDQDALDVAAYLLGLGGSDGEAAPKLAAFRSTPARAERGRQLVTALRCAACHDLPAEAAATPVPLRDPAAGCLEAAPAAGVPQFGLTVAQRRALQAYLAERERPLAEPIRAALALEALNCAACHERDGRGGPDAARRAYFQGDHNLGDTGKLPPPLTGAGAKLQPDWLARTLKGTARVRPYLQTKMPVYGAATDALPGLLAAADARPAPALPPGDIEAGRKLFGTQGGAGCITCHGWGERASLGIHALDISNLSRRLQPRWLRDYLVDPAAFRPGTLMPSFWPGGKAANTEVLGGDTDRQIASLLAFARDGQGLPEGFPATATREFELTPTDRPIVLRTFLDGVGTHAILVGFPAGYHLAYDGRAGRPALAWHGRFFDAYGTWFSRFAPFEKPLGEAVVRWPATEPGGDTRCNGYRLDAAGVPTFLLAVGGVAVEDRFEAFPGGLRRRVQWDAEARPNLPVTHPAGVTVTAAPESRPGRLEFVYTWP